ncbi:MULTISPECIES: hypothetical protein [unclassified Anabaena]|uniref:hypothetical protein n=1 Tax=unclassified Anabaena TaxID=2619674 RepID=UPI0012E858D5|nr:MULTISPECIES: hypothetical protein [unclassified Anabaena]
MPDARAYLFAQRRVRQVNASLILTYGTLTFLLTRMKGCTFHWRSVPLMDINQAFRDIAPATSLKSYEINQTYYFLPSLKIKFCGT